MVVGGQLKAATSASMRLDTGRDNKKDYHPMIRYERYAWGNVHTRSCTINMLKPFEVTQ